MTPVSLHNTDLQLWHYAFLKLLSIFPVTKFSMFTDAPDKHCSSSKVTDRCSVLLPTLLTHHCLLQSNSVSFSLLWWYQYTAWSSSFVRWASQELRDSGQDGTRRQTSDIFILIISIWDRDNLMNIQCFKNYIRYYKLNTKVQTTIFSSLITLSWSLSLHWTFLGCPSPKGFNGNFISHLLLSPLPWNSVFCIVFVNISSSQCLLCTKALSARVWSMHFMCGEGLRSHGTF